MKKNKEQFSRQNIYGLNEQRTSLYSFLNCAMDFDVRKVAGKSFHNFAPMNFIDCLWEKADLKSGRETCEF